MIRIETVETSRGIGSTAAVRIHHHWRNRPYTFWLDSAYDPARLGRFSFVGTDPYASLRADGQKICYETYVGGEGQSEWSGDPLRALAEVAKPIFETTFPAGFAPPFAGGLVGYIAYDVGHGLASSPLRARRELPLPDLVFDLYDAIVCIDHLEDQVYVVSTGLPLSGRAAAKRADERLTWLREEVERALRAEGASPAVIGGLSPREIAGASAPGWRGEDGGLPSALQSNFTHEAYVERVEEVLRAIDAGALDQVNLAQRFTARTEASGPDLYRRLRAISPAPYGGLLRVDDAWILSSSPERFVHMRDDHIQMRPIKGTRPRGVDAPTDARNRGALLASAKDAAEHNMIVELVQTELEHMCRAGSVHVPERMVCEEYATVFHLVSTVVGRLPSDVDRVECIRALFPGASITGRPKLRAMRLIDELESVRRGVYTGALGYLGVGGNVDLNIAIRTLILRGGRAHFHVGGAIVAGSCPDDEHEETLDKAEGIVRALLAPAT